MVKNIGEDPFLIEDKATKGNTFIFIIIIIDLITNLIIKILVHW